MDAIPSKKVKHGKAKGQYFHTLNSCLLSVNLDLSIIITS